MKKLLIVDDEDLVRYGLKTQIPWEDYGFSVVDDCGSGLIAETMVRQYQPDLLLTDIKMPDISGLELIRRTRALAPQMQAVILSAHDNFSFAQDAIRCGVVGYLLKPIDLEELDELMQTVNANLLRQISKQEPDDTADTVDKICIYIHEHFREKLTLERLSREFYITQSYISTLFKSRYNTSFVDYVTRIRIVEAKKLLISSTVRVGDIAALVGFEDYNYFCRLFKKHTGCTPLEYRIKNRE